MSYFAIYMIWYAVTGVVLLKGWLSELLKNRKAIINGNLRGVAMAHMLMILLPVCREVMLFCFTVMVVINYFGYFIAYLLKKMPEKE